MEDKPPNTILLVIFALGRSLGLAVVAVCVVFILVGILMLSGFFLRLFAEALSMGYHSPFFDH